MGTGLRTRVLTALAGGTLLGLLGAGGVIAFAGAEPAAAPATADVVTETCDEPNDTDGQGAGGTWFGRTALAAL